MKKRYTHFVSAVLMSLIILSPAAEARRLGSGGSYGMSRSSSASQSSGGYTPSGAPAQPYYNPSSSGAAAPAPQRSGFGAGGLAAGVAAGALGGYLLGHNNTAQAAGAIDPATGQPVPGAVAGEHHTPWLLIILLATAGLFLYRRFAGGNKPKFIPYDGRDSISSNPPQGAPLLRAADAPYTGGGQALADGSPVAPFLRQARATFLHLQTMNSASHIGELRNYFTADMFTAISADIAQNTDVAEFPLLNAQVLDSTTENGQYIASVQFSGQVSESLNAPLETFSETWHFIKATQADAAWVVAGIQQG